MNPNVKPLFLAVIIIDRNSGKKVISLLNENGFDFHDSFLGRGTAPDEIVSYFGLGETEKVVVITYLNKDKIKELFALIKQKKIFDNHGGIAFSIPLNSVSNQQVFHLLTGIKLCKS